MANNFFKRWSDNKLAKQDENQKLDNVDVEQVTERTIDPVAVGQNTKHEEPRSFEANSLVEEETQERESLPETAAGSDHIESLSVANILADGIKGSVKKQALRKLFLSGEFAEVDRLNDYDHDYKAVKSLSTDAASQLRNWLNDSVENDAGHTDVTVDETNQAQDQALQGRDHQDTDQPEQSEQNGVIEEDKAAHDQEGSKRELAAE